MGLAGVVLEQWVATRSQGLPPVPLVIYLHVGTVELEGAA